MLPERLQKLRRARNITQLELAKGLNKNQKRSEKKFSASQIGNWERGERAPSYLDIRRLADFFSVSTDYLIGRKENETTNLQELFIGDSSISFGDQDLTSQDKYQIYMMIESYIHEGTGNIAADKIPIDHQVELDFSDLIQSKNNETNG